MTPPLAEALTLVSGSSFAVSHSSGDMASGALTGLFVRDVRFLSRWSLLVDDRAPEPLTVVPGDTWSATVLGRVPAGPAGGALLVERRRLVGDGMREDLRVRNLGGRPRRARLRLQVGCDLAGMFAVRAGRAPEQDIRSEPDGDTLTIRDGARGVRITAAGMTAVPDGLVAELELAPRSEWTASVLVVPVLDGADLPEPFPLDRPVSDSTPARRAREWRAAAPTVGTPAEGLRRTLARSVEDLGGLRLFHDADPRLTAVAAGAPWYMALFGRDSLLTSWLGLPVTTELALGTLRMLARRQGTRVDPRTEEEPGRILHESRPGDDLPLTGGAGSTYYGTADATPLFVVLLGELYRWGGLSPDDLAELLPAADRALGWVERYGDRDGDGFVEYVGSSGPGLVQQGWKDSAAGITAADGSVPAGPIALCEVQGYVYAAYRARGRLAAATGDDGTALRCRRRADALRDAFEERFWLPGRGWYAVALDGGKRPVDALTSNLGHCLWSGIVGEERAAAVAEALLSPEMCTGWGVRTLASSMGGYDPLSYHNGSVWPHDSALVAAGLARYGFLDGARRIAVDLLDAAEATGGRLPELYAGFDRGEYPVPVPYPTACSPQAWAAATPLAAVRLLLGLEPRLPDGEVTLAPDWPERYGRLRLDGLRLGDGRVTLTAEGRTGSVEGLPAGIAVTGEIR